MNYCKLLTLTLSSFLFASCVDSKYDLGNVNTDDVTLGDSWVAPLGSGNVNMEDVIDITATPSVIIEEDGSYVAKYSGFFQKKKTGLKSGNRWLTIASSEVDTKDLNNLFDGDFVLSLTNPHIKISTTSAPNSVVNCNLHMTAYDDKEQASTSSEFLLSKSTPKNWIGPIAPTEENGFKFIENKEIPNLIKIVPNSLSVELQVEENSIEQIPDETLNNIHYDINIPFIPAKDFYAVYTERIDNAFDKDFINYIFNEGSATIYGEILNEMPFALELEMVIIDKNNQPIDIKLDKQSVSGEKGDVSFTIQEEDMPKMQMARHIDFKIYMNGQENSFSLKKDQKVTFNLKLKKDGGISI